MSSSFHPPFFTLFLSSEFEHASKLFIRKIFVVIVQDLEQGVKTFSKLRFRVQSSQRNAFSRKKNTYTS